MRLLPWIKMPAIWLRDGELEDFGWATKSLVSRSDAIAALQIYIAILTQSEEAWSDEGQCLLTCELTYNRLMEITGLSRQLVAAGVAGLIRAERISACKVGRKNVYQINGYNRERDWCKLPSRSLYHLSGKRILAFQMFQKRSRCELDALKMFLYYACARDNQTYYSMCSFETISEKTGVPERHIPRANAFLLSCGLLANLSREKSKVEGDTRKEPNKYYMAGHRELFVGQKAPAEPAASAA
jgi:hypothetical protein